MSALAALAAALWVVVLALPWRPWSTRERLEPDPRRAGERLDDVAVLIPARDEAETLPRTLAALGRQGPGLRVVVVDDGSADGTADVARSAGLPDLALVRAAPLPPGWSGKVWAQAQGRDAADRPLLLLLDADIELAPGAVATMRAELERRRLGLLSLMARLPVEGGWERALLPAYLYFFKLLYPFALTARADSPVAAAAGGCILVRAQVLDAAGGFAALRDALIDDCSLARRVKGTGARVWTGLTHGVRTHRRYRRLAEVWDLVARTAYTQLGYSVWRLLACTALMGLAFLVPPAGLLAGGDAALAAALALAAMLASFAPTVGFLGLGPWWALALPGAAALYLAMTWSSALRYHRGERSRWRGRRYAR